jgi:hypothetical protein
MSSTHLRAVELLNITQDADVIALHEVDGHTLQQTAPRCNPRHAFCCQQFGAINALLVRTVAEATMQKQDNSRPAGLLCSINSSKSRSSDTKP